MNPEVLLQRIRIVLCRPSHPGNIGAVARAMKTMGLENLTMVQPKSFPDPEADTRATGAVDLLDKAKIVSNLQDALVGCSYVLGMTARRRDLGPIPVIPRQAMPRLVLEAELGEVALVFGNETVGLSNDELQLCHGAVTIPANPAFSSLNLGAAVQLLCYEARMAAFGESLSLPSSDATPFSSPAAPSEAIEGMLDHLVQVMTATGFYNPLQPGRLLPKLRRLFSRARLESDEVNILRGILASTQKPTRYGVKTK